MEFIKDDKTGCGNFLNEFGNSTGAIKKVIQVPFNEAESEGTSNQIEMSTEESNVIVKDFFIEAESEDYYDQIEMSTEESNVIVKDFFIEAESEDYYDQIEIGSRESVEVKDVLNKVVLEMDTGRTKKVNNLLNAAADQSNQIKVSTEENEEVVTDHSNEIEPEDNSNQIEMTTGGSINVKTDISYQAELEDDLNQRKMWTLNTVEVVNNLSNDSELISTQTEIATKGSKSVAKDDLEKKSDLYKQLQGLENLDGIITNSCIENCVQCDCIIAPEHGITLKGCLHNVCRPCITNTINTNGFVTVLCPYKFGDLTCDCPLQTNEIRGILDETDYNKYLNRSMDPLNFEIKKGNEYVTLIELDQLNLITNTIEFDCKICLTNIAVGDGVTLTECLHLFCQNCLAQAINASNEAEIKCPYIEPNLTPCEGIITEFEIKSILCKGDIVKFEAKSLQLAEYKIPNTFHCRNANCRGFHIVEYEDEDFDCNICGLTNCIICEIIHYPLTCQEYRKRRRNNKKNQNLQNKQLYKNTMNCPSCQAVISKIDGCDAIECTLCHTEICWATKGPRWGPGGKGDISAGCRCKINNRLCTPTCNNCH